MRDQYAGDVSDLLKFGFLRALCGSDKRLGVAWYYAPGDDGRPDGRHREWHDQSAWRKLDAQLFDHLRDLPEPKISALEKALIWPDGTLFHNDPVPSGPDRAVWGMNKRKCLEGADIVFLDPDNGLGKETKKHATFSEVRQLRAPGRTVVFIKFPGREKKHDLLIQELHEGLKRDAEARSTVTLRTCVTMPKIPPRIRWFTMVDPTDELVERAQKYADSISNLPDQLSVTAQIIGDNI